MNRLSDVVCATHGKLYGEDTPFSGFSTDTRQIQKGQIFIALKGEKFDAEEFLDQVQPVASAAIVSRYHADIDIPQIVVSDTLIAYGKIAAEYRRRFKGQIAGITGSSGKTTVKGMLHSILSMVGECYATQGNFNNRVGVPFTLLGLKDQPYAVIEMGTSEPGEIAKLTEITKPDIALVNNVGAAHLSGLGSVEAVAEEKADIYSKLTNKQVAVINLDDDFSNLFLLRTAGAIRLGYSMSRHPELQEDIAIVTANNVVGHADGCYEFDLNFRQLSGRVKLTVPGKHNVANALAAATVAFAMRASMDSIIRGLAAFKNISGRLTVKPGVSDSTVIDDSYNANPASVRAAIDCLVDFNKPKKVLVLGHMGELGHVAERSHELIGEFAKSKGCISSLFACGDFAEVLAATFGKGGQAFADHQSLVAALLPKIDSDTVILVKGSRSAHMEKVVAEIEVNKGVVKC